MLFKLKNVVYIGHVIRFDMSCEQVATSASCLGGVVKWSREEQRKEETDASVQLRHCPLLYIQYT